VVILFLEKGFLHCHPSCVITHQEEYKSRISTYIGRKREKGDVDCSYYGGKKQMMWLSRWHAALKAVLREYVSSLSPLHDEKNLHDRLA